MQARMSIAVGQKLIAGVAILVAVWLGWLIAEGEHILPGLLAGLALLGCLTQLARVSIGTILLGGLSTRATRDGGKTLSGDLVCASGRNASRSQRPNRSIERIAC